jgi:integrase
MACTKGSRGWGHIRKLPSGRFQASYIHELVRHNAPLTFSTKPRAEGWLAEERKLIELDTWTPPARRAAARTARAITLSEYAAQWVKDRPVKARTRLMYESLLTHHIKGSLGKLPIDHVTADRVRSWFSGLGSEHTRRNSHVYGLLHAVMATAVKDGLLQANPCQIERVMNPQRKREPVILSVPEVAALAAAVPERLKAAVLVSAWCGVRWGELIELRRHDIDVDAEVLFVGRGATHRGGCDIGTTKSGKPRAIVIPPHVRTDLKHHMDVFADKGPNGLVFPPQRGGCHLNDKVFRDAIAKPLEDIGRDNLRIHDLRHFAGTQIARVGNLAESIARLGHSTVRASLLYQSVVSGRDAEIAAALSALATNTP